MRPARAPGPIRGMFLAGMGVATLLTGCATELRPRVPIGNTSPPVANLSPFAEDVLPGEAWHRAEAFAAIHPHCEVLVGRGNSMLPLYRDRTVLVVQRMELSRLRPGMTVVFLGDRGLPVAHTLVAKTSRGWIARGLANAEADADPVRLTNYIGTVVKAFAPREFGVPGGGVLAKN